MEHQPLRSTDVRDRNQKLVLRLLFQNDALSQSQVVQRTGLKAPTVFRIFTKLEEDAYIRPCAAPGDAQPTEPDRRGRRPLYYCAVPGAAFAVGVDFSTSGASVIVVNFVNEVIHHESREFASGVNRDEVYSRIGSMIGAALDACSVKPRRLVGIGIGAPGVVNTETGIVEEYSRIPGLAGSSVKAWFGDLFGVPVFVHNNTSVIAASEYHYGTATKYASVLAVLIRGGVGGAFIDHGRVFVNGSTTALELGRTSVRFCPPKETGGDGPTLESIVGEGPLLEYITDAAGVDDWAEAERQLSGERIAAILSEPATILSTAVRNFYHVLHPEAVLVISRYRKLSQVLADAVGRAVPEAASIAVCYDPVKACYGATDLVFQRFFTDLGWPGKPATGDTPQ